MRKLLFLLLTLLATVTAWAEGEVSWRLTAIEGKGPAYQAVVEATIKDGWHLYPVREQEGGPSPTYFTVDGAEVPKINGEGPLHTEYDQGFKKDIDSFKETAKFLVPVTLKKAGVPPKIIVNFQVCKDGVCIPPQDVTVDVSFVEFKDKLTVMEAKLSPVANDPKNPPSGAKGTAAVPASTEAQQIEDAQKKGLIPFLLLAIAAGFGALLTPCVFPMIPITVSFFSKKKEGESALGSALLYCGGIVGTFTLLGILTSIFLGATGLTNLANDPILNLILAGIFIVLSLSLFGLFEIGLPSKFVNKFDHSKASKVVAPILMGLTFSLTSFTCTLPFVGAVLVGASQGSYLYPALGMLAFSTAFSLPFFLLALFPSMASKLPKSGGWMTTVKAYLGFIELVAAVKFLSTVDLGYSMGLITREVNIGLWFTLLAMAAAYMFGWIRLPKVYDGQIGPLRVGIGVLTLGLAFWILSSFNGTKLGNLEGFLPPSPYPGKAGVSATGWEKDFVHDWEEVKKKAAENGKPIFIDFTGIYCTNCRVMEINVFPHEKVQKAFAKFNKVSLYTDRTRNPKYKEGDKANSALQQKLVNTVTLPTYVVVKPDGETVVGSVPFLNDADKFAEWLNKSAE